MERALDARKLRVAAYDFGLKRTILRLLADHGIRCTVYPAETPPSTVARGRFDGVFLSNGPGNPSATVYGVKAARELLGTIPILFADYGISNPSFATVSTKDHGDLEFIIVLQQS